MKQESLEPRVVGEQMPDFRLTADHAGARQQDALSSRAAIVAHATATEVVAKLTFDEKFLLLKHGGPEAQSPMAVLAVRRTEMRMALVASIGRLSPEVLHDFGPQSESDSSNLQSPLPNSALRGEFAVLSIASKVSVVAAAVVPENYPNQSRAELYRKLLAEKFSSANEEERSSLEARYTERILNKTRTNSCACERAVVALAQTPEVRSNEPQRITSSSLFRSLEAMPNEVLPEALVSLRWGDKPESPTRARRLELVRKLVAEKLKDETDRAKVLARYAPAILEKTEKSPETALRIADFLRRSPIMPQWTKQSLDGASREIRSAEVKFTVLAADTLSRQLTEKLASGTEKEASARPRSVEGVAAGIQVEGLAPADGRRNIDRQESLSGPSYFEHLRAKELDEQRQSLAFGKLREILETFAFETARVKSLDKVRSAVRDEVFQQALKAAVELAKNLIDLRLAPRLLRSLQDPHYRHRFETRSAFALVEAARAEAGLTQAA